MKPFTFSIVIPTYNRPQLLMRAIESILAQANADQLEIIVVDDGSSTPYSASIQTMHPRLRYERLSDSQGPGVARNRGIALAQNDWVILFDDDDQLQPDCLQKIQRSISQLDHYQHYPVFNFICSNALMPANFLIATAADYCSQVIKGDFTPVIQRQVFVEHKLAYPPLKIGGEALLWWSIAERWGIPTWNMTICRIGTEAPSRLTHTASQLARPDEHALLHEMMLSRFQSILTQFPDTWRQCLLGAATYYLLATKRQKSRHLLRPLLRKKLDIRAAVVFTLTFLPLPLVQFLFKQYKYWTAR